MATFGTFSERQQAALRPGLRPLDEAKLARARVWHGFSIYLEK